jgi:3-hydroxybutyryl-CoA dehydrogenase
MGSDLACLDAILVAAPRALSVAVLGAGTMGAGIAQVAMQHGHSVIVYDVVPAMLDRGKAAIEVGLAKLVEKGRLSAVDRAAALSRLQTTTLLDDLTDVDLVIEAAPESMEVKGDLFRFLDAFCRPDTVLATNTSSLSVTAIAALTHRPHRVLGLHFFNPAPVMALVEIIAAQQTGPAALELARNFTLSLGKTPIECRDTPGFIVNRVARPFYGEALKILGEGGASARAIDASLKAAGFRMGPFELMDLIGIDVNFAVTQSVFQAFFGEARFRPHPLQQQMVAAGKLGRKTDQGFYKYQDGKPIDLDLEQPVSPGERGQRFCVIGAPKQLASWGRRCIDAGQEAVLVDATGPFPPATLLSELGEVNGVFEVGPAPAHTRQALQRLIAERLRPGAWLITDDLERTATAAMADHGVPTAVVGDWAGDGQLWEVAFAENLGSAETLRMHTGLADIGVQAVRVADHPGLVFARVISMLVNEAAFALQEDVATANDIDRALLLGANYPTGPLAWAERLGTSKIVALLDAVHFQLGEERYRVAPLLRRRALAGVALVGAP